MAEHHFRIAEAAGLPPEVEQANMISYVHTDQCANIPLYSYGRDQGQIGVTRTDSGEKGATPGIHGCAELPFPAHQTAWGLRKPMVG